jgi:hypothetical protein
MGFIRSTEATSLPRLREELVKKSPDAAAYLKDALAFVEAQALAEANALSTIKNGIGAAADKVPDTEENQLRIAQRFVDFLLSKIRVESPVNQMMLVGYLADRAKHYSGEREEKPFIEALESLLLGADQRLRVFAAASLSMKKLKERRVLTPILLTGLESQDFSARYFSLTALQAAGIPETCFNPLDTPEQRRQPLATLKQWWQEEARKQTH